MPKSKPKSIRSKKPNAPYCIACNDTGLNSKGGVCVPCQRKQQTLTLNASNRKPPIKVVASKVYIHADSLF